ncbi:MAG: hypothetical protein RMN53_15965 [Anaerolineae bacterium]|nr:hypothetical protein [Anaerolineae bacterium]
MSNRRRQLEAAVAQIRMRYGPRAVCTAAAIERPPPRLSTTFPALDRVLEGGLPIGGVTEIVGMATSGKATLAAKAVAAAQADRSALAAWMDLPRGCDVEYLHRCSVDLERLLIVRPRGAEDGLAIATALVESHTLAVLVFDGGDALHQAGPAAVAAALERLRTLAAQGVTAVIFLVDPRWPCPPLAGVAALRLALRREEWLTEGRDVRGYTAQVAVVKHKLGRSGAVVPIRITFNGSVHGA